MNQSEKSFEISEQDLESVNGGSVSLAIMGVTSAAVFVAAVYKEYKSKHRR